MNMAMFHLCKKCKVMILDNKVIDAVLRAVQTLGFSSPSLGWQFITFPSGNIFVFYLTLGILCMSLLYYLRYDDV